MSKFRTLAAIALYALGLSMTFIGDAQLRPAEAGAGSNHGISTYATMSCGQLWYQRNARFAQYGYCFRSGRAISVFGRRCHAPYGQMPRHVRSVVAEIRRWERVKGCR